MAGSERGENSRKGTNGRLAGRCTIVGVDLDLDTMVIEVPQINQFALGIAAAVTQEAQS